MTARCPARPRARAHRWPCGPSASGVARHRRQPVDQLGRRRRVCSGTERRRRARTRSHSPDRRGCVAQRRPRACDRPAQSRVPHLQQLRRDQRGREHDEQHGGVQVVAQHALLQADRGEDQPDLTARQHAETDEQLVARRADRADRRHELADDGDHEQDRRRRAARRPRERADVGVDADLQEEHRDEQVADRRQLPTDAIGLVAAVERETGDEGADDRRELARRRRVRRSRA